MKYIIKKINNKKHGDQTKHKSKKNMHNKLASKEAKHKKYKQSIA